MTKPFPSWLLVTLAVLLLIVGCVGCSAPIMATPTAPLPSATPLPTQPPTSTPTTMPSPTDTPQPTATRTAAPPTPTPTRTPPPVTNTPKPTQPPAPTKAPASLPPTAPPSAPGVDVVAARGQETCINKFISVSFPWEEEPGLGGRHMYFEASKWSVYLSFARPNIKLQMTPADCPQNQCRGFTADFCVYVDADAPPGGIYESAVNLEIYSAFPPPTPVSPKDNGKKTLAETNIHFSWQIK